MKRYLVASLLLAVGCSDGGGGGGSNTLALPGGTDPKVAAPTEAAPPAPALTPAGASQAPLPGQAAPGIDSTKETLLAEVRNRKFKNEDFVESESNRDPYHSFLTDFSGGPTISTPQYEILLPKYSLDELKLAMIVGPPTVAIKDRILPAEGASMQHVEPRAMFVDPTGMGVAVVRGKHLSKADAKVIRIEPDKGKVFVEIKEDLGGGKFRMVERVLELHQGDLTAEGNQ
jgi:hypothetical protein